MLDDFASAIRQIRRNPGFTCAVVLTLTLGIGATTAVFTLADPMLFRPLPYPDASRLVRVSSPVTGTPGWGLHLADYFAARERHSGFEQVTLPWGPTFARVPGHDGDAFGYFVDRGFLEMLRVQPVVGRPFLDSEYRARPEMPAVALITWGLWQSAFGGRPDIVEESLQIAGQQPVRIVGVLPPDFVFPDHTNRAPDVLLPGERDPSEAGAPNIIATHFARLKPGVSIEAATAEMQVIVSAMERDHAAFAQGREVNIVPLQQALFGPVRTPLILLLSATTCLLLLACANLAHLFLARLHARRRELGVRLALGSAPSRLLRQLLAESALLALAGGAAALVAAQAIFTAIMAYTPQLAHVYRLLPARVDLRVAAFAGVLAAGALAICALLPALAAARTDVRTHLAGGTSAGTRGARRLQRLLIGAQAAMAVTLLVTSWLIVGSFVQLAYQPLGWDAYGLSHVVLTMPEGSDPTRADAVRRAVYERLEGQPGIRMTLADGIPAMTLPAGATRPDADPSAVPARAIAYRATETVFDVLGLRVVRGRAFDGREVRLGEPVAVIDERAAERLWPGQDPMGRQLVHTDGTALTVVGVVRALRVSLRNDATWNGAVFLPLGPAAVRFLALLGPADLPRHAGHIQRAVTEVEPSASVRVVPVGMFERELGQPRFLAVLLGALGLLTIALAIVGVFGVVSHQTTQRTREVGVRIALGAQAAQIRRMIVRDALLPAAAGVAIGAGASLWWTQTLRAVLYALEPNDPATFAAAAVLVLALVIAASLLPAAGVARTDPVRTLRME